ncbi:MAG: hypothetical protein A3K12_01890 [Candidatus Rokubacteria bacterium RIFCSPLOWO2_12_FULL_71_19]|nr:MAG: hypothetical protein A3K12_01890 [Candidatus Rokubacteria bacterium RIFCSPLOWO2_12_FULL_71_19]
MIADVVFDLSLRHSLAYLVPDGLPLLPGQRVRAPLAGRTRVGVVVELRPEERVGLKPITAAVEPVPILSRAMLDLGRWAAQESLSSLGATLAALLPPPPQRARGESVAPPPPARRAAPIPPELWVDAARESRLVERLGGDEGASLVIAPDIEGAARWAERLDAARLDSGVPEGARRTAWFGGARGRPRILVGTRSALLAPLPPPATLVLLDEHDPAHKPPGAPRMHSRDLLVERARLEGSRLLLLSATPAAETWWRADSRHFVRRESAPGPWPEVITADTRGILRNHPLTLPLTRAIEEMSRRGRRTALVVTREAAALGCDECGAAFRCPDCGVALALSRRDARLTCGVCSRAVPLPAVCPGCGGHRLSPFGWGAERVEASLRRRFPRLGISRATGSRLDPRADVVIGTAGLLRGAPPGSLGCVGFVAVDGLLRMPDFRAGERAFASLWAAAEAVGPGGRVIVQTLHPEHYALRAVKEQSRTGFYASELKFRAELGYPPFRRLCLVSIRGRSEEGARALAAECAGTLRGIPGLTVYPAAARGAPGAGRPLWRFAIKGPADLPRLIAEPLRPVLERGRRASGVVEVEMDPLSLA